MRSSLLSFFVLISIALPLSASAATAKKVVAPVKIAPLEVSGWIPYWRTATGTADVLAHLNAFSEVNPFGYTVSSDGMLFDAAKLDGDKWQALLTAAHAQSPKIKVIPSVMWADPDQIHHILSNKKLRQAHENSIVAAVKAGGFDGIDLDYEGKLAETRPYFSLFLKELYKKMGNKIVDCTIEARTPAADRFMSVPQYLEYANDFKEINKYCDRVRIMAYDQGRIDLKLNASTTEPYVPIADTRWVEKVMRLTMKDISPKKLEIGVPTYGYEYDLTAYGDGYEYSRLWAFNPGYAVKAAQQYGVTPGRSSSGELEISYYPSSDATALPPPDATSTESAIPRPVATVGSQLAAAAMVVASSTNSHSTLRYATWSDAQAIADKIALARKLGVRGIAIFKIDGGEDPALWNVLPTK